jgi:hypothetical protein
MLAKHCIPSTRSNSSEPPSCARYSCGSASAYFPIAKYARPTPYWQSLVESLCEPAQRVVSAKARCCNVKAPFKSLLTCSVQQITRGFAKNSVSKAFGPCRRAATVCSSCSLDAAGTGASSIRSRRGRSVKVVQIFFLKPARTRACKRSNLATRCSALVTRATAGAGLVARVTRPPVCLLARSAVRHCTATPQRSAPAAPPNCSHDVRAVSLGRFAIDTARHSPGLVSRRPEKNEENKIWNIWALNYFRRDFAFFGHLGVGGLDCWLEIVGVCRCRDGQ